MEIRTKRFLAMFLVFAFCIGLMPAGIFANQANAAQSPVTLKAVVTREENEATPDEATPDAATADEAFYRYVYTLNILENETAVTSGEEELCWYNQEGDILAKDSRILKTDAEVVTAVLVYDGIKMTLNTDDNGSAEVTVEPKAITWEEEGIVGVLFELPSAELVEGVTLVDPNPTVICRTISNGATPDEATIDEATPDTATDDEASKAQYVIDLVFTPDEGFTGELLSQDGKYYTTTPGTIEIKQMWRGTDGEVVYAQRELSLELGYPEVSFYADGQPVTGEIGWYTEKTTVTLKLTGLEGLVSEEYLPRVTKAAGSEATWSDEWIGEGDTREMTFADLDTTTTLTYGLEIESVTESLKVKVDLEQPTITFKNAYFDDGMQYILFDYTVGESGLQNVIILGLDGSRKELLADELTDEDGKVLVVLPEAEAINPVKITIYNNAGKGASTANANGEWIDVQPDLLIDISSSVVDEDVLGVHDGVSYLNKENEENLTVTIKGANEEGDYALTDLSITAKDQHGNDIAYIQTGFAIAIPLVNGLSQLQVTVTDGMGRTASSSWETSYGVDEVSPEITSDWDSVMQGKVAEVGNTSYFDAPIALTFTITDAILAEQYQNGSSRLHYSINGESVEPAKFDENGHAVIELEDGMTLTDVKVVAYDLTGNTAELDYSEYELIVDTSAPEIELWLSEEVTGLYQNANGNFAVVPEGCTQVTVYAKITDANLNTEAVNAYMEAAGWTINNGIWEKALNVDDNATISGSFSFMAVDMADNYAAEQMSLRFDQNAQPGELENILTIDSVDDNGKLFYTFELNLDNRAPSSVSNGDLEIVINESPVADTNIFNESFTVTIKDESENGFDSGINNIIAEIKNVTSELPEGSLTVDKTEQDDGSYLLTVNVNDEFETNATLVVTVSDHVGNSVEYALDFIVDNNIAPVIEISREVAPENTYHNVEYFDTLLQYTVSVNDLTLREAEVEYKITGVNGAEITKTLDVNNGEASFEITIEDGQKLESLTVRAKDAVNHSSEESIDLPAVVDTTAPVAQLTFSDNVSNFYVKDGVVYVILDEPANQPSGVVGSSDVEEVTATLTITDRNFAADDEGFEVVGSWEGEYQQNQTTTLTLSLTSGEVQPDGTAVFAVDAVVADLAGNKLTSFDSVATEEGNHYSVNVDASGKIDFKVSVDRRRATSGDENGIPVINVTTPEIVPTETADQKELYNGNFNFHFTLSDGAVNENNSGIKEITYSILDSNGVVNPVEVTKNISDVDTLDGTYVIPVIVNPDLTDGGESNDVTLTIQVTDNANNVITYTKTFGVDTLKPRVTLTQSNSDVHNSCFFNNDQTITVVVEDLNFDGGEDSSFVVDTGVKDNDWTRVNDTTWKKVLTYNEDGDYTFTMQAMDLADNLADINYQAEGLKAINDFVVDKTAPVVDVDFTFYDEQPNTMDGVDYYNKKTIVDITVTDVNLSQFKEYVSGAQAYVTYTVKTSKLAEGTEYTIDLLSQFDGALREDQTAAAQIVLNHGDVLTDLEIVVVDNASNKPVSISGFAYNEETQEWVYTGNDIAVDVCAPVITVEKQVEEGSAFIQSYNGVDYYNGEVTYLFSIADKFLAIGENDTRIGEAVLVIEYQDRTETVDLLLHNHNVTAAADQYHYSYTITDGEMVENMTLSIRDNAGNLIENGLTNLNVIDQDNKTAFAYDEAAQKWTDAGNDVVVDKTAPTAELTFSDNVKFFYFQGNTAYVSLNHEADGNSGEASTVAPEDVTVTIKAKDLNLALGNGIDAAQEHGFAWTGTTGINTESTVTFKANSTAVNADGTKIFVIDVDIKDLAGNALTEYVQKDYGNDHKLPDPENGSISFITAVDRRRPTSLDFADTSVPTIEVTPSVEPDRTTQEKGELELYNGDFSFNVKVNDGALDGNLNSGVYSVYWKIEDAIGAITNDSAIFYNENRDAVVTINIPVDALADRESNQVKLTIVAEDNVGNTITYEKIFAVDTLKPRVVIEQSNLSHIDKYFKDNQTITVTVTDLNFDAELANSFVDDTGNKATAWTDLGNNQYQIVRSFTVDGEYTFAMQAMDRAGNQADIDYTRYESIESFVIDKTAPVITVTYSHNDLKSTVDGVDYYAADRWVYVEIEEKNFNAADVNDALNGREFLTNWTSNGTKRNASYLFSEGNGYRFTVTYTDMAGNVSVLSENRNESTYSSPTFSVDTTAPEIKKDSGIIQENQLTPITDTLILDFDISDAQGNLSDDVVVELDFMDRSFSEQSLDNDSDYYTVTIEGNRAAGKIVMRDVPKSRDTDGIYTLQITVKDHAGNEVKLPTELRYSLNRYGSTYIYGDDATKTFLTGNEDGFIYHKMVENDLVIKEINPNMSHVEAGSEEEGSVITVSVNGKTTTLAEGTDYTMTAAHHAGSDGWAEYTYTISRDIFLKDDTTIDGDYTVYFYSEDLAGHKNSNEVNEGSHLTTLTGDAYSGKLNFTLDSQDPVLTIIGVEDGEQYFQTNLPIQIDIADNTATSLQIFLDDAEVPMIQDANSRIDSEDWYYYDEAGRCWRMNLAEHDSSVVLKIVVTDAAGNSIGKTFDVQVTDNLWYLYIENPVALVSTAVGAVGLILVIVLLLNKRKKKKAAQAAAG